MLWGLTPVVSLMWGVIWCWHETYNNYIMFYLVCLMYDVCHVYCVLLGIDMVALSATYDEWCIMEMGLLYHTMSWWLSHQAYGSWYIHTCGDGCIIYIMGVICFPHMCCVALYVCCFTHIWLMWCVSRCVASMVLVVLCHTVLVLITCGPHKDVSCDE